MNIHVVESAPQDVSTQVFITGLFEGEKPSKNGFGRLDATLGQRIERAITTGDFEGRKNQVLALYGGHPKGPRHILIVGLGPRNKINPELIRRGYGLAGKQARAGRWNEVTVLPPLTGFEETAQKENAVAALEGVALAMYRYYTRSRQLDRYPKLEKFSAVADDAANLKILRAAAKHAGATIEGVNFARDLVCMPPGELYPESYAKIARKLEGGQVKVEVLDHKQLAKLKMGAILAIGRGSAHPPCVIHLSFEPKKVGARTKTFAIVGKGVTFDSGGLDIKNAEGMRDMKVDMAGSAAVMGVFKVIEKIQPKCRVHGFVAAVENMTDGAAYHPGDILTAYNGVTIEVDNTDAEGRLALADALSYAADTVKPDAMVDLATLTGACVIALGHWGTGLMGNDDALYELLRDCGRSDRRTGLAAAAVG